jgi:tRNA1(Val) A37 N6-methylase TrmN6
MKVINDLFDYENIKIVQDEDVFKFSIDSILLAEYVKINTSDKKIIDLCSGNLPIPLILNYKYPNLTFDAIELQKYIYELGKETLNINNINNINYINDNVENIFNYYEKNSYDIVICNPPYFKNSLKNDNAIKSIARHEIKIDLEKIINISANLLKDNKCFYLVHIPNRIDEIILLCNKNNMNVKEIYFVNNSNNKPVLILVKAVKNAKIGLKLNYINNINLLKSYKNIFEGDKK